MKKELLVSTLFSHKIFVSIVLASAIVILIWRDGYQLLDVSRPFQLGREFDRSALDVSLWLEKQASNNAEKILVSFVGPVGSLYNYHVSDNPQFVFRSGDSWLRWNSLMPADSNICTNTNQSQFESQVKELFISNHVEKYVSFKKYFGQYKNMCSVQGDAAVAFIWVHKSGRFRRFDCYNRETNQALPPTFGSCSLVFVSQKDLFENLSKNELFIVASRFYFITQLLDRHPDFEAVFNSEYGKGDKSKIYRVKVNSPKPLKDFDIVPGYSLRGFLNGFKEVNVEAYNSFIDEVLKGFVGVSSNEIVSVVNRESGCIEIVDRDYSIERNCKFRWKKNWSE